ncbi:DHHC-type zinc finger family protein, partial [Striga asiatica]
KVQVTSSKDITRLITGQNIPDIVDFDSDFLTLCQREEANNGKDQIGEEEVSTPVKSLKGKEKVGETSNAKKNLMDSLEDEGGFAAQSTTADKGKAKVTEQDDEMKDNFAKEFSG